MKTLPFRLESTSSPRDSKRRSSVLFPSVTGWRCWSHAQWQENLRVKGRESVWSWQQLLPVVPCRQSDPQRCRQWEESCVQQLAVDSSKGEIACKWREELPIAWYLPTRSNTGLEQSWVPSFPYPIHQHSWVWTVVRLTEMHYEHRRLWEMRDLDYVSEHGRKRQEKFIYHVRNIFLKED